MTQLDLFDWAEQRPTAEIINWIPHLARRMWAERGQPAAQHEAQIMALPMRGIEERKIA